MTTHGSGPREDRDAILDALQDQIDDLAAALAAQQKLIDAHNNVIVELARLAGLGANDPTPISRDDRTRRGSGGDG